MSPDEFRKVLARDLATAPGALRVKRLFHLAESRREICDAYRFDCPPGPLEESLKACLHWMEMQEHRREADIKRGETLIATGVVIQRGDARAAPVRIPGQATVGYKDLSRRGPTTIVIDDPDPEFREELEQLLAIGRDVELARSKRGWAPDPVTIEIGSDRYEDARLDRPLNPYGGIGAVEFGLHHEGL